VRIEIPATPFGPRRFQHTLRLGSAVSGPIGSSLLIGAPLGIAFANSSEIDDVAHRAFGSTPGRLMPLPLDSG